MVQPRLFVAILLAAQVSTAHARVRPNKPVVDIDQGLASWGFRRTSGTRRIAHLSSCSARLCSLCECG